MSYIVLARKWRPKRFEDVVGQEHISTTLLNSIRSDRTAHAYLFVGPRGIGKTSTARIFAKALNCSEADNGEPCGECDACREITDARSMDVIEIDGASNNGVEDIRMLRENVKIAPSSLKFKVYIIDEVHMLSTAAFNAFLKTLEEPPAHVKFVMATTEAQKVPATVLSRCQRFDFRRLTSRQIFKRLKQIVDAEGIRVDEGALFSIARSAEGSMRDSQSIMDQLISFSDGEIKISDVQAMLGTVGHEVYQQIAASICEGDSARILKTIDDIVERGKDLAQFLKELTLYFRNLLVTASGAGEELIDMPEEELSALKQTAAGFKLSDLIRIVRDLSELESRFRQLPSPRIALEMLLMRMARVGTEISIDNLLSKLTALEKRLQGSPVEPLNDKGSSRKPPDREEESEDSEIPPGPHTAESGAPPEMAKEEPEQYLTEPEDDAPPQLDLWREFLDRVREQSMSAFSFLGSGQFCGIENGEMIISFDNAHSYHKTHLEKKEVRMLLEATLKAVAGQPLKMKLIIQKDYSRVKPARNEVKISQERNDSLTQAEENKKKLIEEAQRNPIVKKAVELFKGKIVYVSG